MPNQCPSSSFLILYTFHTDSLSSPDLLPIFSLSLKCTTFHSVAQTRIKLTPFINCLTHPPCPIKYKAPPILPAKYLWHSPMSLSLHCPLLGPPSNCQNSIWVLSLPSCFFPIWWPERLFLSRVKPFSTDNTQDKAQTLQHDWQGPSGTSPCFPVSSTVICPPRSLLCHGEHITFSPHTTATVSLLVCVYSHLTRMLITQHALSSKQVSTKFYWIKYYGNGIFNKLNPQKQISNKRFCSHVTLCSTAFFSAFCISALSRFSMSKEDVLAEAIVISRWCNSWVKREISIFIPSSAEL